MGLPILERRMGMTQTTKGVTIVERFECMTDQRIFRLGIGRWGAATERSASGEASYGAAPGR
jgi:hypothetical protein